MLSHGCHYVVGEKQAEVIQLPPGSRLAGIRFHPAIGFGVLGRHYEQPTLLSPDEDPLDRWFPLFATLKTQGDSERAIAILYQWLEHHLDFTDVIPDSLESVLDCLDQEEKSGQLSEHIDLSQRQIERIFKTWLGMTPNIISVC
ncbi:hypothetical protein P4S72_13315 [Vibrio sp. PP-XX7]